mgnify:CR=1 FL=1
MNFANEQFLLTLLLYGAIVIVPWLTFCKLNLVSSYRINLGGKKNGSSHEVLSTIKSFIVLYGVFHLCGFLQDQDYLGFHQDLPTWYYALSFPLVVLIHDAYFYWTHYLMHKSRFFHQFHKEHHKSHDATPLDVFAFHPVEAFIHFIFFAIYPMIIPTTLPVMQFMFVWMLVCNSAGHLPYEFYPKFLYDFPIIRQFNAATHHQMHHKYYNSNFSIYYNWWDRWMGTNHKDYFVTYRKVKARQTSLLKKPNLEDFSPKSLNTLPQLSHHE